MFGLLNVIKSYRGGIVSDPTDKENGHEYVDLGLSVKWAYMNIGAYSPEECGNYYAWGETAIKENYWSWNYSPVANEQILPDIADVAQVKWRGKWRIPSEEEGRELVRNCTIELVKLFDVEGYRLTSKINGNSIFFPLAGYRFYSEGKVGKGFDCYIWLNNKDDIYKDEARYLMISKSIYGPTHREPWHGLPVRPVFD